MADSWSEALWTGIDRVYQEILGHPFIRGVASGDLDPSCFRYYLAQDAHYLRDYARALAVVGAKAPSHSIGAVFARHAAETAAVEMALHESLLPQLGLDPADLAGVPASPTTTAYTSYLLAATYGGGFAAGLAAVLPCYWIYQRVGTTLVSAGSPDPRYQRWIDAYAGDAFGASVAEVLAITDAVGPEVGSDERARAAEHFAITSRYEWMFWDAAWRQEAWPV